MQNYGPRKPRAVLESGLTPELAERLDKATDLSVNPYAPSRTAFIRRGLELALTEYEAMMKPPEAKSET